MFNYNEVCYAQLSLLYLEFVINEGGNRRISKLTISVYFTSLVLLSIFYVLTCGLMMVAKWHHLMYVN